MAKVTRKKLEYKTETFPYTGHLVDPSFLEQLNVAGAEGWKRSEEQQVGSGKLAVLFERETVTVTDEEEKQP